MVLIAMCYFAMHYTQHWTQYEEENLGWSWFAKWFSDAKELWNFLNKAA